MGRHQWLPTAGWVVLCGLAACTGDAIPDADPMGPQATAGQGPATGEPAGSVGDGSGESGSAGDGGSSGQPGQPGTGNSDPMGSVSEAVRQTFPTGLAVASPADLARNAQFARHTPVGTGRYLKDMGRAMWRAATELDLAELAHLTDRVLGLTSRARAETGDELELKALAMEVESVLAGADTAELGKALDLPALFTEGGDARCYGPMMPYAMHEDAMQTDPSNGQLPTGDLGMWLEREPGSDRPCVAAQLSRRIAGIKGKTQQALVLTAAMRMAIEEDAALAMPAAGETVDATAPFAARLSGLQGVGPMMLQTASISLSESGDAYTYRLVVDRGSDGMDAGFGEVVLQHRPGTDEDEFSGLLRVSAFHLTQDRVFGCPDDVDPATNAMRAASVATIQYARSGTQLQFGSRSGAYCGHPTDRTASDYASQVAALETDGQLDLSARRMLHAGPPPADMMAPPPPDMMAPPPPDMMAPPPPDMMAPPPPDTMAPPPPEPIEDSPLGWIGNSTRFAGDFDLETVEGDFLFAWQAGTGDSHARTLALDASYNAASDQRTLQGFFGFADAIAQTDGTLLGMICNWAGPGHSHDPRPLFQSQTAVLTAGQTEFTLPEDGSRLAYAPTNSCSSTTTSFDVNADAQLDPGEGVGLASELDLPTDGRTVHEEIAQRGFAVPSLY